MKKIFLLAILSLLILFSLGVVNAETHVFEDEGVSCEFNDNSISCDYMPNSHNMLMSSSNCGPKGCEPKTVVAGRITNPNNQPKWVEGADVTIVCDNGDDLTTKTTKTFSKGFYVVFFEDAECTKNDWVTVTAEDENGLIGTLTEKVKKKFFCDGHIVFMKHIPLVPEFGVFIGALTIFSAVGVFFLRINLNELN